MTQLVYENLWHYSEQFSRDPLQRSELLTMAFMQEKKLGDRCTIGLMKSMMHFRSRELNRRSAFPAKEIGKRTMDAWNHDRVYIDRPVKSDADPSTLAEFLLPVKITPLDFTITNDFLSSLTDDERSFLDDLTAGYSMKDISKHTRNIPSLRQSLQQKAVAYL
jgi:hypothetical protein